VSDRAVGTLLAAAAGAVDVVALVALGGAFAGIVTGNLVTAGTALSRLDGHGLVPIAVAVGGFTVGVLLWAWWWRRRPTVVVAPLAAEAAVLAVAQVLWFLDGRWPVLALVAVALGGQSVAGLRLRMSTTYMTGALTTAAHGLVRDLDWRGAVDTLRQLGALVLGAVAAALLVQHARPSALALPLVLVVVAALLARRRPGDAA
jgi:uncharacterized membrane protein YoaK (UPF0700 family)